MVQAQRSVDSRYLDELIGLVIYLCVSMTLAEEAGAYDLACASKIL